MDQLEPFLAHPAGAVIVTDFDGTLAPIVNDPREARALDDAVEVLHALAARYGTVAVVSGRPVAFLVDRLDVANHPGTRLHLVGLYGLESAHGLTIEALDGAEPWRRVIDDVATLAEAEAPEGVWVERKGLALTLHVRTAPELASWAQGWATTQSHARHLVLHPARMSWELRPPIEVDKGTIVAGLVAGSSAACFAGDDVGDLPAFDALDRCAAEHGTSVLKVGVRSDEAPPELVERADLLVDGPHGVLELFRQLL